MTPTERQTYQAQIELQLEEAKVLLNANHVERIKRWARSPTIKRRTLREAIAWGENQPSVLQPVLNELNKHWATHDWKELDRLSSQGFGHMPAFQQLLSKGMDPCDANEILIKLLAQPQLQAFADGADPFKNKASSAEALALGQQLMARADHYHPDKMAMAAFNTPFTFPLSFCMTLVDEIPEDRRPFEMAALVIAASGQGHLDHVIALTEKMQDMGEPASPRLLEQALRKAAALQHVPLMTWLLEHSDMDLAPAFINVLMDGEKGAWAADVIAFTVSPRLRQLWLDKIETGNMAGSWGEKLDTPCEEIDAATWDGVIERYRSGRLLPHAKAKATAEARQQRSQAHAAANMPLIRHRVRP